MELIGFVDEAQIDFYYRQSSHVFTGRRGFGGSVNLIGVVGEL